MPLDDKISVGEARAPVTMAQLEAALKDFLEVVSEISPSAKLLSAHQQARVLLAKIEMGRC